LNTHTTYLPALDPNKETVYMIADIKIPEKLFVKVLDLITSRMYFERFTFRYTQDAYQTILKIDGYYVKDKHLEHYDKYYVVTALETVLEREYI